MAVKCKTEAKLLKIKSKIAKQTEHKFAQTVRENLGSFTGDDSAINTNGLWNSKNKIMPKDKRCIPMALNDKESNLLSSPDGIKQLSLNEMIQQLRHRKIHPDLTHIKVLKDFLWKKRLKISRKRKIHYYEDSHIIRSRPLIG